MTTGARIPLVIGATGHRDLRDQDVPALEAAVDRLLTDLTGRFPHTPLTVISQLAEGADRLVVRVAKRRGARIVALLPMPRVLYEPDFVTDASKREFAQMLGEADRVVELDLPSGVGADEVAQQGATRDARYTAGGIEVNRASHLLFALWDGEQAVGSGGTGDIVESMLKGPSPQLREVDDFLHFFRLGPVAHIWTPRRRGTGDAHPAGQVRWLHPSLPQWEQFDEELNRQLGAIEHFNADVAQREQSGSGNAAALLPESARCRATETAESKRIEAYYGVADSMADELQATARRTYICTLLAGLVVLSFFQLNVHHHTHHPVFLMLFLLFMAISAGMFFFVWKPWTHERYLDYRSLAEAMRVQFFWTIGGTDAVVIEYLPPRQREELQWLRLSLLGCAGGPSAPIPLEKDEAIAGLQCAQEHWLRDQRRYFEDRVAKRTEQVEWHSAYKTSLIAAGLVTLLTAVGLKGSNVEYGPQPVGWLLWARASFLVFLLAGGAWITAVGIKRILTARNRPGTNGITRSSGWGISLVCGMLAVGFSLFRLGGAELSLKSTAFTIAAILSVLCAVAATVLELYGEHFAFRQHMRRYRMMADLFARADEALTPVLARKDVAEARRLIIELGRESLAENTEWIALHRERPIRLLRPR